MSQNDNLVVPSLSKPIPLRLPICREAIADQVFQRQSGWPRSIPSTAAISVIVRYLPSSSIDADYS